MVNAHAGKRTVNMAVSPVMMTVRLLLMATTGFRLDGVGMLRASNVSDPDAVIIKGMAQSYDDAINDYLEDDVRLDWTRDDNGLWQHQPLYRHNAFVTNGLNAILERMGGIGTTAAITHFHFSADAQAVTLATTQIDPAGGATGRASKTVTNTVSAAVLTVTSANFTQADITFAIAKQGVANVSTDPGTTTGGAISGVWDIIGGTGGVSPFNQAFSADYTGSTSFTLSPVITITASN